MFKPRVTSWHVDTSQLSTSELADGTTADVINLNLGDEYTKVVKIKVQGVEFPNCQRVDATNCNVYFRIRNIASTHGLYASKGAYVDKVYHVKMPFGHYQSREEVWAAFAREVSHVVLPDTGGQPGLFDDYNNFAYNQMVDVYSAADDFGWYVGNEVSFEFYFLWYTYRNYSTARDLFGAAEEDAVLSYATMGQDPVSNQVLVCSDAVSADNALVVPGSSVSNAFGVCQITENNGTIFLNAGSGEIASLLFDVPTRLRTLNLSFANIDGTRYSFGSRHYSISFDIIEVVDADDTMQYQSLRGV